jgi:xylulokinase
VDIKNLKVGNDNLFLSDVFSKTIANTLGISIQMLKATGAEGAAKASISDSHQTQKNDNIVITKTINPNPKLQDQSIASFEKWKAQLFKNVI